RHDQRIAGCCRRRLLCRLERPRLSHHPLLQQVRRRRRALPDHRAGAARGRHSHDPEVGREEGGAGGDLRMNAEASSRRADRIMWTLGIVAPIFAWYVAAQISTNRLVPGPIEVFLAFGPMTMSGELPL